MLIRRLKALIKLDSPPKVRSIASPETVESMTWNIVLNM